MGKGLSHCTAEVILHFILDVCLMHARWLLDLYLLDVLNAFLNFPAITETQSDNNHYPYLTLPISC